MNRGARSALLSAVGVALLLLAPACDGGPDAATGTLEVTSGKSPNASVRGTVTYRERLALTPGAKLVVELRDVSYQDAAAPLIARQTISDPGQVPIGFEVGYNRDDVDSRNVYSIQARIIESDGRLAFTNDTAYEVITRGNPSKVDMVLVLVRPPPEMTDGGSDWRQWVETPVQVISANLMSDEREHLIRVVYYQSTIEGCSRPGSQSVEVDGYRIIVRVTLMRPPPTPRGIPCYEEGVEVDAVVPVRSELQPGRTYWLMVNDRETARFTLPASGLGHTVIAESPIETTMMIVSVEAPEGSGLRVVSRLPKGSGCTLFNGYEIRRRKGGRIDVVITHHEVTDPPVPCIADFPTVETFVPTGRGLEPGVEYTFSVHSARVGSYVAR